MRNLRHALFSSTVALGITAVSITGAAGAANAAVAPQTSVKTQVAKSATATKTMKTSSALNLREKGSIKSKSLKVLPKGTIVTILSKASSGWSKVKTGTRIGWVSSKYLTSMTTVKKAPTAKKSPTIVRGKIMSVAKKHVGAKYRFGGTSPKTGWDCSGFVQYVFKESGVKIPRTKAWVGHTRVNKKQAKPGDLVVQRGGSHVGIYAGNSKMYHAANPRTGTVLAPDSYSPPTYYKILSS